MRRGTQRETVLQLLGDGRWHSTIEFVDLGILRAAARVFELRRAGVVIESRERRASGAVVGEYRLLSRAAPPGAGSPPSAGSGLLEADQHVGLPTPATAPAPQPRPCFVCEELVQEPIREAGQWFCRLHASGERAA